MADEEVPKENELESRQGNLYPVGRALRRTFDAENHDSLGTDLTGLMLELARIDPEAAKLTRGALPVPAVTPLAMPAPPVPSASWWSRLMDRLRR